MIAEKKIRQLLTTDNAKTIKGEKLGYVTYILYMSPFKANSKRINVCAYASAGCAEVCLFSSGFGGIYSTVAEARTAKTEFFLSDRETFLHRIKREIQNAVKRHTPGTDKEAIVTVRLNGTSDISWEKHKIFDGKNIFEIFPNVQFYDYTKNWTRFDKPLPPNYYLTFSRSESNHEKAMELLRRGVNVAMVFDKLPETYEGFEVVNADETDLRFLDKRGVICGLKYKKVTSKGGAEKNRIAFESGFVIQTQKN